VSFRQFSANFSGGSDAEFRFPPRPLIRGRKRKNSAGFAAGLEPRALRMTINPITCYVLTEFQPLEAPRTGSIGGFVPHSAIFGSGPLVNLAPMVSLAL